MGIGRIKYPACLLDACALDSDREGLSSGDKKTTDTITVSCAECGTLYPVKIQDIYRRKISSETLIKPLLCKSCGRKRKSSYDGSSIIEEKAMEENMDTVMNNELDETENKVSEGIDEDKSVVKGVDIYVENDVNDLDRMLGIAPSPTEIDIEDTADVDNVEQDGDHQEDSIRQDLEDAECNKKDEGSTSQEDLGNTKGIKERISPLLSDFMSEDNDSFTYLCNKDGFYQVCSIPKEDKKSIRMAVKSPDYIFRYPKFSLKDKVLGFHHHTDGNTECYEVYFPEYSVYFEVDNEYKKPFGESFKEYFEDLVQRVRPRNMGLEKYDNGITITSLKVLEIGLLEVITDKGRQVKLLLNNDDLSFNTILDYIREISDTGEESINLPILSTFFKEVI